MRLLRGVSISASLVGLLYAFIQAVYTAVVVDAASVNFRCSIDVPSNSSLIVSTGMVALCAVLAFALAFIGRPKLAVLALGGEVAFAFAWAAFGGWTAAGCVIG